MRTTIIAAHQRNHGMGIDNRLPWNIPADLARFKKLTKGHPVIMGRMTFESIPDQWRPLPGRTNIVVTSNPSAMTSQGIIAVTTINDALAAAAEAPGSEEVFFIGGERIYKEALRFTDRLLLTIVDAQAPCDVFFPEYGDLFPIQESRKEETTDEGLKYAFVERSRS